MVSGMEHYAKLQKIPSAMDACAIAPRVISAHPAHRHCFQDISGSEDFSVRTNLMRSSGPVAREKGPRVTVSWDEALSGDVCEWPASNTTEPWT